MVKIKTNLQTIEDQNAEKKIFVQLLLGLLQGHGGVLF